MNERDPSEVTHVLFRKESGWTPTRARSWLADHGVRKSKYETMNSKGGSKLKRGTYYVFKVSGKKHSSYGYSDESKKWPGLFFKFGGSLGFNECGCF